MSAAGDRFKSAYDLVVRRIEARYHIPVSISDVLDPNTGDFDGLRILVDYEAGVTDLDQWLSDWWDADWRYLEHYYKTGDKLDFRKLLEPGKATPLTPIAIPDFTPQKWLSRWSF